MVEVQQTENEKTLQSYEANAEAYVAGTPHIISTDVSDWIHKMLENVPTTPRILEIGSAFGREADYIEAQGFTVQRTDATQSFVTILCEQGHNAYPMNVLTDELGGQWDLIFANCVFLHFTTEEFKGVLIKIFTALTANGTVGFSVKRGEGFEWSDKKIGAPRFFQYWDQEGLRQLVANTGFTLLDIRDGLTAGDGDKDYVIASKQPRK